MKRLETKLTNNRVKEDVKQRVVSILDEYLRAHWNELRFLTFAENESFMSSVAELAVSGTNNCLFSMLKILY